MDGMGPLTGFLTMIVLAIWGLTLIVTPWALAYESWRERDHGAALVCGFFCVLEIAILGDLLIAAVR